MGIWNDELSTINFDFHFNYRKINYFAWQLENATLFCIFCFFVRKYSDNVTLHCTELLDDTFLQIV